MAGDEYGFDHAERDNVHVQCERSGFGGTTYTEGTGIDISGSNVISVDFGSSVGFAEQFMKSGVSIVSYNISCCKSYQEMA